MAEKLRKRLANLTVEERRRLLAKLGLSAQGSESETSQSQTIPRIKRNGNLPLSFAQQRLWLLDQIEENLTAYNMLSAYKLQGKLNTEALRQALETIAERHESLRTTFSMVEGEPVQVIRPNSRFELPIEDLSSLAPEEQETELVQRSQLEAERIFDLTAHRMLRARLLKLSGDTHILLLTMHHIASDGWSRGVLLNEINCLYDAYCQGKDADFTGLPVQYADYAVWQREKLSGKRLEQLLVYWREQLDGVSVLNLPTDYPRPAIQTYRGNGYSFELSSTLVKQLSPLSQSTGVTLQILLLAAFQTVLARYSGQDDIATGTPIAGRNHQDFERLIGFFVNTLVIRTDFSGDPSFLKLLKRVRKSSLGAYDYGEVPFEKLVEELQPERRLNLNPLFQVLFQFMNFPAKSNLELKDLEVSPLKKNIERVHFDLEMNLLKHSDSKGGIGGSIVYNTDLFEHSRIERMAGHFVTLLEGVVANPYQRISELPLLTAPERRQLLEEWNDTVTEYPRDKCIHELFEEQVERTPDAIAIVFEEEQLTYRKLNNRANQLAKHLVGLGIGPEVLVGIYIERSIEMLVAILGVLKAGGAYLPLDLDYPRARLEHMLTDAASKVLLTQRQWVGRLPNYEGKTLCVDEFEWDAGNGSSDDKISCTINANNLAYVIYTSGSTGKPKGVEIKHHSVVNLLHSISVNPGFIAKDIMLAVATICFDISVVELFLPLVTGGRLVIASRKAVRDGYKLRSLLDSSKATFMLPTPTTWQMLLEVGWEANLDLKMISTGEALPNDLADKIVSAGGNLWNLYGPTETTVWSTCCKVDDPSDLHIGKPIANTQVYVLDVNLQPTPVGVPGELMIAGDGLARGYLGNPDMTAEKFISNPFQPGERMYRTGDLAMFRADGNIRCLGRIDNQVKLRGFRIELGEIESRLNEHPAVKASVVVLKEHNDQKQLVAYYLSTDEESRPVESSEVRACLKERLPDYMVPSTFVRLDEIPLTANGKIDRKKLEKQDVVFESEQEYVAPKTAIEKKLAAIWEEVLKIEKIGIHDNFFDLGGHSLLAIQLVNRIRNIFEVELPLRDLFEFTTIEKLACRMGALHVPNEMEYEREQGIL